MENQVKPPTVDSVLRPALRLRAVSPPSALKVQHSERACVSTSGETSGPVCRARAGPFPSGSPRD